MINIDPTSTSYRSVPAAMVDVACQPNTALACSQPDYNRWTGCQYCYYAYTSLVSNLSFQIIYRLSFKDFHGNLFTYVHGKAKGKA